VKLLPSASASTNRMTTMIATVEMASGTNRAITRE
jgi:hypothetical protein